jgi:transcriptional regulator with XRE-family HTH domain
LDDMTDTFVPSLAPIIGGGSVPTWSVSDRLRKAREHAGLDQDQLARFAALSRATISAAENGRTHLRSSSMRLWAISTGVSLEWLETGEAPPADADGAPDVKRARRDSNPQPSDPESPDALPSLAAGMFIIAGLVTAARAKRAAGGAQ